MKSLLILLLAVPLSAQTVKVHELTPEQTKKIQHLYTEQDRIAKELLQAKKDLYDQYEKEEKQRADGPVTGTIGMGIVMNSQAYIYTGAFDGTYQFSSDYRFVVPATPTPVHNCNSIWGSGNMLASPVGGENWVHPL